VTNPATILQEGLLNRDGVGGLAVIVQEVSDAENRLAVKIVIVSPATPEVEESVIAAGAVTVNVADAKSFLGVPVRIMGIRIDGVERETLKEPVKAPPEAEQDSWVM